MPINDFGELFYQEMLATYLSTKPKIFPLENLQSLDYIKITKTSGYKKWFTGIINKSYKPGIIPDFQKWQKQKK